MVMEAALLNKSLQKKKFTSRGRRQRCLVQDWSGSRRKQEQNSENIL